MTQHWKVSRVLALLHAAGVALLLIAFSSLAAHAVTRATVGTDELNTVLMHATFLISGPKTCDSAQGPCDPQKTSCDLNHATFGTVFVMARPPEAKEANSTFGNIVLVTARHVLDDICGDEAFLLVRRRETDGSFTPFRTQIQIREHGKPLYVTHSSADVAAMYGDFPDEVPMTGLTPDFLADDKRIEELGLHPGDEVFFLGFPYFAASIGGFPILRSGHLASYPLMPMESVKRIALDGFVYDGNSGGPVYYSVTGERYINGQLRIGVRAQSILGLVIQKATPAVADFSDKPLDFGVIVPAIFIRETIDKLPSSPLRE
jgi:hypothetical protein